jgi:hypothetical protein
MADEESGHYPSNRAFIILRLPIAVLTQTEEITLVEEHGAIRTSPQAADEAGSQARTRTTEFVYAYSCLLNALHAAFNGAPDRIDVAIGLMYELRMIVVSLMKTPIGDGSGQTAGPSFECLDTAR